MSVITAVPPLDLDVEGITPEEREMLLHIHGGGKLDVLHAVHVCSTKGMSREEWERLREREGYHSIGGSEAAAVVGMSPYESPYMIFVRKRGRELGWKVPPNDAGERARFGSLLEPIIRQEFVREARTMGKRYVVVEYPWLLRHPDYPFMMANIDGLIYDVETGTWGILEIKTADKLLAKEWYPDRIPHHYIIQVFHYMAVLGPAVQWAVVAVLIGGNDLQFRFLPRNDSYIETIVELERRFWEQHILTLTPPEAMGLDKEREMLKEMFPPNPALPPLKLTPELARKVRQLEKARALQLRVKKRVEQLENQIRAALQEHTRGEFAEENLVVEVQEQSRSDIDRERLKDDGLYAKYQKRITFTKLVVNPKPAKGKRNTKEETRQ